MCVYAILFRGGRRLFGRQPARIFSMSSDSPKPRPTRIEPRQCQAFGKLTAPKLLYCYEKSFSAARLYSLLATCVSPALADSRSLAAFIIYL